MHQRRLRTHHSTDAPRQRRRRVWTAAFAACASLFGAVAGVAAQERAAESIAGRVLAPDSAVIAGAVVEIVGTPRATVTNPGGEFRIGDLRPGTYRLRVRRIGFRDEMVEVSVPGGASPIVVVLESAPLQLAEVIATANPLVSGAAYQALDVLEGETLHRRPGTSVGTLLDSRPGISARSFGPAPARPVIRGFDGERVVVLQDGERMGDTQERAPDDAVSLDPLSIDRVEVVRGPASLLYGSSALGGVVNLLTRDVPTLWTPGVSGEVALDGATVNRMLAGSVRTTYGAERWAVSGRLSHRDGGDATTPSGALPNSHLRTLSAAAGTAVQAERFAGGAALSLHSFRYGIPEFAVAEAGGGLVESEPDGEVSIDRLNVQARSEWFGDGFLRRVELRASGNLSWQQEGDVAGDGDGRVEEEDEEVEQEIETRGLGMTVLVGHAPIGPLSEGVFGTNVRFHHQDLGGLEVYHPGQRLASVAGYFFEEVGISSRARVQFGGRLEREWTRTLPNEFFDPEDVESSSTLNVSGSIGINLRPAPGVEIGAQLARAHRSPSVVERYASGWDVGAARVEIGDPDLGSEIGHGLDLFTRFATSRVAGEFALFGYSIRDYVTQRALPPGCGGIEIRVRPDRDFPPCVRYVATDAHMMGGEVSLRVAASRTIALHSQAEYVRGEERSAEGDPLPFIPPARGLLGVEFDDSRLLLAATGRLVAAQRRVPPDELPTGGYGLLDLEAGYRLGRSATHLLTIRLGNALDSSYSDHLSAIRRYPEPVAPDNPVRFDMPGRSLDVSYRVSF